MTPGTKLYRVCNGNLVVVKFIESQIVDGGTLVTYTVQDKDGRKSVGTDYYQEKELEAWNLYIDALTLETQAERKLIYEAHVRLKILEGKQSDATLKKRGWTKSHDDQSSS